MVEERAEMVALSSVVRDPASSVSCRSGHPPTALPIHLCPSGLGGAWHGNKQLTRLGEMPERLNKQLTGQLTRLGKMPERLNKQLTRLVKMPERLGKVPSRWPPRWRLRWRPRTPKLRP